MEEEYNGALRERIKDNIKEPIHYVTEYVRSNVYSDPLPKIKEIRIPSRRGKDDRPQDYNSKEKVRILNDRRTVKKNLPDII